MFTIGAKLLKGVGNHTKRTKKCLYGAMPLADVHLVASGIERRIKEELGAVIYVEIHVEPKVTH